MGGQLIVVRLGEDFDDDYHHRNRASGAEEEYQEDDEDLHNEDLDNNDELVFGYSYGGWFQIKGDFLRDAIAYLADLEKKTLTKEDIIREEITVHGIDRNDRDAQAKRVITAALQVAGEWVRQPTRQPIRPGYTGGSIMDHMRSELLMGMMGGRQPSLNNLMDFPYNDNAIQALGGQCPLALAQAGMRGLYLLMRLPGSGNEVYDDEAQHIAKFIGKVNRFCDWSDEYLTEDGLDLGGQMQRVFELCTPGKMIRGG